MSAETNQRLVRAGFDSHKTQHTMVLLGPDGCPYGKETEIPNTRKAFECVRAAIDDAMARTGAQGVSIGVEATSFYHLNLVSELAPYYKDIRVYNPKLLCVRRLEVRDNKNDHKDALKIAWAMREGVPGSMPYGNLPLMEVQELCRFQSRMVKDRSNLKKRFLRNLHVLCPGYDKVVRPVFARNSTRLLEKYPSAEAIRGASLTELKAITLQHGKYGLRDETIQKLLDLARGVPDCPYYRSALLVEQRMLLKRILSLDRELKTVGNNIKARWRELDMHPRYFRIDGFDIDYAITIYTETGDLTRFPPVHKFIGFLGLDPWTKRTDDKVSYGRLTKMGSRYAREALGNAVVAMRKSTPMVKATWDHAEARGRKYRERMVICMRKLARVMWGMENHPQA